MPKKYAQSNTIKVLEGRILPFSKSPVRDVQKISPEKRRIVFENGKTHTLTKQQLNVIFQTVLSQDQAHAMLRTARPNRDGRVTMKIGGIMKGVEKTYSRMQGAIEALKRRYGVDPTKNRITRRPTATKIGRWQRQQDDQRGSETQLTKISNPARSSLADISRLKIRG